MRIADLYKSSSDPKPSHETIEWNPIDDTVCTAIHSAVMPCSFPHWMKKVNGKRCAPPSNDRLQMVEKALRKNQEKKDKEQAKQNLIKKNKAERKKEMKRRKQQLLAKRRPKFQGESLDPNELFDKHGNINILDVAGSGTSKEHNHPTSEHESVSDAVCLETYCRQAGTVSDDSIDL